MTRPSLIAQNELPLPQPPQRPGWTENYCIHAYDPDTGFGAWLHLGLPVYDNGLWHDLSIVYLPGGDELLVNKGFVLRASNGGISNAAGACLQGAYDEETGDWTWTFHGAAQRTRRSDLVQGALVDGPFEPLRFALKLRGICPVWDLSGDVGQQTWSVEGAHWEQPCRVTGSIEVGGQRHAFNGIGLRDHSRGSRNFEAMGPHYWLHGQFPNGEAFGLLQVGGATALNKGYVVRDGRLFDARVIELPADRRLDQPFEIVFADDRGEHRVQGEVLHEAQMTVWYPNEIFFGHQRTQQAHLSREAQVRWRWNGQVGHGLGERTVRLGPDGQEDEASLAPVRLPKQD